MSSFVHTYGTAALSDREHTWADEDGGVHSVLDLGSVEIVFDSADLARQVAARCLRIAEAIEALAGRDGSPEADEACPRCRAVTWGQTQDAAVIAVQAAVAVLSLACLAGLGLLAHLLHRDRGLTWRPGARLPELPEDAPLFLSQRQRTP